MFVNGASASRAPATGVYPSAATPCGPAAAVPVEPGGANSPAAGSSRRGAVAAQPCRASHATVINESTSAHVILPPLPVPSRDAGSMPVLGNQLPDERGRPRSPDPFDFPVGPLFLFRHRVPALVRAVRTPTPAPAGLLPAVRAQPGEAVAALGPWGRTKRPCARPRGTCRSRRRAWCPTSTVAPSGTRISAR